MSFRLVPKLVTLNDLERRNGVTLRYFSQFGKLPGALHKSSRSLSHLLMSSCTGTVKVSRLSEVRVGIRLSVRIRVSLSFSDRVG